MNVKYPIKNLVMSSGPAMKVVSVSINKAPTTMLPLTCSNVLSSMFPTTVEPKT